MYCVCFNYFAPIHYLLRHISTAFGRQAPGSVLGLPCRPPHRAFPASALVGTDAREEANA